MAFWGPTQLLAQDLPAPLPAESRTLSQVVGRRGRRPKQLAVPQHERKPTAFSAAGGSDQLRCFIFKKMFESKKLFLWDHWVESFSTAVEGSLSVISLF